MEQGQGGREAEVPQQLQDKTGSIHAPRIFISYRRDDAAGDAGRLYDALSVHFGKGSVFMDVDSIQPGADFAYVINEAVGSCDVLVTVIGKNWLSTADGGGGRRLDNQQDLVRLEIQTALESKIRVIPALVQGAHMPRPDQLPASIAMLAGRNAFEINHSRWKPDVERLIATLENRVMRHEGDRHNLPDHLTTLIGRESEIRKVLALIQQGRLVTLTGSGGVGKTRLALRVAAELIERFRGGVWFIDLAPVRARDRVAQAVCDALGLRAQEGQTPQSAAIDYLKLEPALLVMDNCEHLADSVAALVADMLVACRQVRVIATSRELLGMSAERAWRVPSLAMPEVSGPLSAHEVANFDAISLFCARARNRRDDFELTNDNAGDIARICARLDGIPLGIELAAARIGVLTPAQILVRLDDRFRLLTGGSRTAVARQQTLQAAMDWSHDLLSEQEQLVFRRLAVFSGGCTLEAAETVCASEDLRSQLVLDVLDSLVSKSLVMSEPHGAEARYRLLETVRHYAQQKLADANESQTLTDRHLDYYWSLARRLEDRLIALGDEERWGNGFVAEGDNLRAAFDWAVTTNRWTQGTDLASGLVSFLTWESKWSEVPTVLPRVKAHIDECPLETAAFAYATLCWVARTTDEQRSLAHRVLELVSEPPASARSAMSRAMAHLVLVWNDDSPEQNIRGGLAAARQSSRYSEVTLLTYVAEVWISKGNVPQGRDMAQQALDLCEPGWLGSRSQAYRVLAISAQASGDYLVAQGYAQQAASDTRGESRLRNAHSAALRLLSQAAIGVGDYVRALQAATDEIEVASSVGGQSLATAYNTLGVVAGQVGDLERAREAFNRGLPLTNSDSLAVKGLILGNLGTVEFLQGRFQQAEEAARASLALAKEAGDGASRPSNLLGLLASRRGDTSAVTFFSMGLRACSAPQTDEIIGLTSMDELALSAIGLAGCIASERPADAARLLGATTVMVSQAAFLSVIRRSERDRLHTQLREQLGDDALVTAIAAGRSLPREAAMRLMLASAIVD